MRLVFAGTPAAAVPTLRRLAASHDIAAVVTRPDAPLGRRRVLTASPVAQAAEELGLPIIKAARLDDAVTAEITALEVDLGVIVAYGGLVREPLLSAPSAGWINLHFSLLPAWRGAAPVQRALIAGDAVLGASVFQLVAELDAGDVFATHAVDVPETATAGRPSKRSRRKGPDSPPTWSPRSRTARRWRFPRRASRPSPPSSPSPTDCSTGISRSTPCSPASAA